MKNPALIVLSTRVLAPARATLPVLPPYPATRRIVVVAPFMSTITLAQGVRPYV